MGNSVWKITVSFLLADIDTRKKHTQNESNHDHRSLPVSEM